MIYSQIAVPGPAHPSHPIPPVYEPPKPIIDPTPPDTPDDDPPGSEPHRPMIDPNRGVKQPPPVYARWTVH
jgi:hypothetical protein